MDPLNIGRMILLIFIYLVSIPCIIYYTYRFYQHKSSKTMFYRQPLLIVCLNFLVISSFIFGRTPRYVAAMSGCHYPTWLQKLVAVCTSFGITDLFVVKSYLVFFQHKYHTAIQKQTWAKSINHNWNNWYIGNKNKWGNFRYILKWLLIAYSIQVFAAIISEILLILGYPFMQNVALPILFTSTQLLVLLFSVLKLGRFNDIFGIRREMLMQCVSFTVAIILFVSIQGVSRPYLTENQHYVLAEMCQGILIIVLFTGLAISSAYYPLYLIRKNKTRHEIRLNLPNKDISLANLLQCFADFQLFSYFMNHLVKEFATESALFVVEWCQIKNAYQLCGNRVIKTSNLVIDLNGTAGGVNVSSGNTVSLSAATEPSGNSCSTSSSSKNLNSSGFTTFIIDTENGNNMGRIQISYHVPESGILQQYPNDIKSQVQALYDKYIIDGSLTQINIPFTLKEPITKMMLKLYGENDICDGDLWCSLDSICLNTLGLLLNPFSRFTVSAQYIDYNSKINDLEKVDMRMPAVCDASFYDKICQKYK